MWIACIKRFKVSGTMIWLLVDDNVDNLVGDDANDLYINIGDELAVRNHVNLNLRTWDANQLRHELPI